MIVFKGGIPSMTMLGSAALKSQCFFLFLKGSHFGDMQVSSDSDNIVNGGSIV